MDPLSITSGAIAVLQIVGSILNICFNTRAMLKQKPWSLSRVQDEIQELRGVLESILQLAFDSSSNTDSKGNKTFEILAQRQYGRGPLVLCLEDVRALEEMLLKKYSSEPRTRAHAFVRALMWDLSRSEVDPILDRLARSKAALNLVISADEMGLLIELNKWSGEMTNEVVQVNRSLESISVELATRSNDETMQNLFKWLSPIDSWDSYATAIKRRHDGTGNWFLQSSFFQDWRDGCHKNLWLSGFAGCGKTVLISHVIKELMRWAEEDTGRPKVAYFFCDFRNSESQDLAGFLGSIICHTLPKTGNIPTNIAKTFHTSTAGGTFRKPELPFLLGVLKTLASKGRFLVVMDALDEVEDKAEFLNFFHNECHALKGINFLIASRESDDIRKSLEAFHHIRIEDQVALVDEDITNYISYRLKIDPDLHWLGSNVKGEILDSLRSRASGMFRWVQCQLETMCKLRTVKAVRQSLHQLPHDLYESYERILERVVDSDWSALRRILLWVLFAVRPLTLEELHTAVAIDLSLDFLDEESLLRHPREILTLGSGLLSVTEKGHVSLVHLSIKSYLTSTKIQQSKTTSFFALSSDESTTLLFRLCMKYISYGDFSKGPCRSAQEYIDRLQKYPFLNHAARTWPYYYRRSTPSEILHDTAINFFSEENRGVFMSWVQAINADTPFSWHFYPHHATSLYYAATFGLTHIVRHLVDIGVDLNAPGSRYWGTALHGAVYRMHTPIVKLLLEAGADVNKADSLQVTPLHTAATLGDIELIRLLLHFSANTGATDGMGESPIDWASKCGQMSTRDLLLGEDCGTDDRATTAAHMGDNVWEASDSTIPYFPDFHGLRSGLESSIILRVEVGGQILTEEDNPTDISL